MTKTNDTIVSELPEKTGLISKWPKSESIIFEFDERRWKVGYAVESADDVLIEYVLESESVDDWTEIVTTRLFKGSFRAGSVGDAFKNLEDAAREGCAKSHWLPLIEGAESILYEWHNEACNKPGEAEYEMAKIFLGAGGIERISYAARDKKTYDASRDMWLEKFINAVGRK